LHFSPGSDAGCTMHCSPPNSDLVVLECAIGAIYPVGGT
jgi:hypothetical protein